jgi:hypothetical protein
VSDRERFDLQLNLSATRLRVINRLKSSDTDGEAEPPTFAPSIVGEAILEKEMVLKHASSAQTSALSVYFDEEPLEKITETREWADQKYGDADNDIVSIFSDLNCNASRVVLSFRDAEYSDIGKLWDLSWGATIYLPPETLRSMEEAVLKGVSTCNMSFYCSGLEYEERRRFIGEREVLVMAADMLPGYLTALSLATPDEAEALESRSASQVPTIYQNKLDLMVQVVGGLAIWTFIVWGFNKLLN